MPRPFEMIFLVTYDIPSTRAGDRRRTKLAKHLLSRGLRVQWSVFEIPLPPEKLPALCAEIAQIIVLEEDSVRLYPLCAACANRVEHIGVKAVIERDSFIVW